MYLDQQAALISIDDLAPVRAGRVAWPEMEVKQIMRHDLLKDFVLVYGAYNVKDGRLIYDPSLGKKASPLLIRRVK